MRHRRKHCPGCDRWKPRTEFYAHPATADGLLAICKECHKAKVKGRYWADPETSRAKERKRNNTPKRRKQLQASLRRQRERDPARFNATSVRWSKRNPEKRRAYSAVGNAIRDGKLKKGPCEGCGEPPSRKVHAHHADYAKPLEVRWLCTRCHGEEHRAENEAKRLAERESTPAA